MFRRTAFFLYEGVSGDKGHMTLQQACTIFGFEMNQEWTQKDVKKRFRKLALKFHPDNGGTKEQFQMLKEAHKIVMTHRHDRGARSGAAGGEGADGKGGINFRRMNYDDMTNTIHRQTSDRIEYRSFSLADFTFFLLFVGSVFLYYVYNAYKTQMSITRSRWSFSQDDLDRSKYESEARWHPWRADYVTRDRMDDIALLQNSVRQEVVDERRSKAPRVYTPWQSGGPFARSMAAQKYDDDEHDAGAAAQTEPANQK